jgi:hypothetical protein
VSASYFGIKAKKEIVIPRNEASYDNLNKKIPYRNLKVLAFKIKTAFLAIA